MSRAYKSIDITAGKNRLCLRCFNCKTRVFRNLDELAKWCEGKELTLGVAWKKRFKKDNKLTIYWCTRAPWLKPRIYKVYDNPFQINCKTFDGGDLDGNT